MSPTHDAAAQPASTTPLTRREPRAAPRPITIDVEAQAGTLTADVWGGAEGDPVLLLHGLPGSRLSLRRLAEHVAGPRPVVVPDLLGFGDSRAAARSAPHAREQARSLLALIERHPLAGGGGIHLAGCDFGGPTAVWLVRLAPERFRSLALVASNLFADTPVPPPLRALAVPGIGALLARAMLSWPGLLAMWRGAAGDRAALPWRRFWRGCGAPASRRASRQILRASLRDLEGLYRPIQDGLGTLRLPALVVWGDRDPFFPPAQPRRTAAAIPGARLQVLPGCGHFVAEERPAELADALRRLWEGESSVPATG